MVSADEGTRLTDLKPFIRDRLGQMERDLDTDLDWVAVARKPARSPPAGSDMATTRSAGSCR